MQSELSKKGEEARLPQTELVRLAAHYINRIKSLIQTQHPEFAKALVTIFMDENAGQFTGEGSMMPNPTIKDKQIPYMRNGYQYNIRYEAADNREVLEFDRRTINNEGLYFTREWVHINLSKVSGNLNYDFAAIQRGITNNSGTNFDTSTVEAIKKVEEFIKENF